MPSLVIAKYTLSLFLLITVNMMMLYKKVKVTRTEIIFVLLFFVILLHSIFFSSELEKSVERSLFSLSFILMLFSVRLAFDYKLLRLIRITLLLYGIVVVIINDFILLIFGKSSTFYVEGNFIGLSSNANTFGLLISVFLLPAVLSFLINIKRLNGRVILLFLYSFNLIYIMFETRSRAALGVFVVLLFTSILIKYRKKSSRILIGGIFTLALIPAAFLLQDSLLNKYENNSKSENSIFSTRMVLWIHRIEGIQEKPLLGWGYQVNSAKDKFYGAHIFNELEKGNTPLAILEEFGTPLGMAIIFLLYSFAIRILKLSIEYSIVPLIIIGALAHSMFETWLFNFNGYFTWILWVMIFLGCLLLQKENNLNQRSKVR